MHTLQSQRKTLSGCGSGTTDGKALGSARTGRLQRLHWKGVVTTTLFYIAHSERFTPGLAVGAAWRASRQSVSAWPVQLRRSTPGTAAARLQVGQASSCRAELPAVRAWRAASFGYHLCCLSSLGLCCAPGRTPRPGQVHACSRRALPHLHAGMQVAWRRPAAMRCPCLRSGT